MCAIAASGGVLRDGQLVLFGGRDSASGETLGVTYCVTVVWAPPSSAGGRAAGSSRTSTAP